MQSVGIGFFADFRTVIRVTLPFRGLASGAFARVSFGSRYPNMTASGAFCPSFADIPKRRTAGGTPLGISVPPAAPAVAADHTESASGTVALTENHAAPRTCDRADITASFSQSPWPCPQPQTAQPFPPERKRESCCFLLLRRRHLLFHV